LESELKEAMAKGAVVVGNLEKKDVELQQIRQRLSETEAALRSRARDGAQLADGARLQGDLALREVIGRLAADIVRLSNRPEETAPRLPAASPDRNRRRAPRAPSSQGPDTPESIGAAKVRHLQPTAPER
jgi:hypothetical protein